MKKEELLIKLKELLQNNDTEKVHVIADKLLLEYINDTEIEEAYGNIHKWYA
jgi:hypothetical protein